MKNTLTRAGLFAAILFLNGSVMTARATTFVVTNTNDSGAGSLRNAITQANLNPGADVVSFDISPRHSLKTIVVQTNLPAITDELTFNGWSQGGPGYDGPPLIELRGNVRTFDNFGLRLQDGASNSLIRGLIINSFPTGVAIEIRKVTNVTVAGCYIGTSADGNSALPNREAILVGGYNCRIGGPNPRERNVLSGNGLGVHAVSYSVSTTIEGNYIGVSASGSIALGNVVGIDLEDFGNDRIGGLTAGQRNVIAGNEFFGIIIQHGYDDRIQGNYIGTAADGLTAMGNQHAGIRIEESFGTLIGGGNDSAGNVISANGSGIELIDSSGNKIQNNLIGVAGNSITPLGNVVDGILIVRGNNNTIGGVKRQLLSTPSGNTIAFNGRSGVRIDDESIQNLISANSIHHNLHLGIDLLPEGVTANDSCDLDTGANLLENFPVIESVTQANGFVTITGNIFDPTRLPHQLEFFSNTDCNASGNGEGQRFIGSIIVAPTADCQAQFSASFHRLLAPGEIITATATDAARNTSEFSPCFFGVPR